MPNALLACPSLLVLLLAVAADATGRMEPIAIGEIGDALLAGPVLLMFRHGESEHNACPIFRHVYYDMLQNHLPMAAALRLLWFNPSLTESGREQARRLGNVLRAVDVDCGRVEVWTSTMARAIETAVFALPRHRTFRASDLLRGRYAGIASGLRPSSGRSTTRAFSENGLLDTLDAFLKSGPNGIHAALFPTGAVCHSKTLVETVEGRVRRILQALRTGTGQYGSLQAEAAQLGVQLDCDGVAEVDPHFEDFASSESDSAYLSRLVDWLSTTVTEPKLYVVSSHKHSVEKILELGGLHGYDVGNGEFVCVRYMVDTD